MRTRRRELHGAAAELDAEAGLDRVGANQRRAAWIAEPGEQAACQRHVVAIVERAGLAAVNPELGADEGRAGYDASDPYVLG